MTLIERTLPRPGDHLDSFVIGAAFSDLDGIVTFEGTRAGTAGLLHLCTDPAFATQWRRDASALAAVKHHRLCRIHGAFELAGFPACWSDRFEGRTLEEHLAHGRPGLTEVRTFGEQLLDALAAVHDAGVLVPGLDPRRVRLREGALRLGLLPAPRPRPDAPLAPELRSGSLPDVRSDIHAVGVLLYTLAVGSAPFDSSDSGRELVTSGRLRRPRDLRPDLPEGIDRAIMSALEPDRDQRCPDAHTVRALWRGEAAEWERPSGLLMLWTAPPAAQRATPAAAGRAVQPPPAPVVTAIGSAPTAVPTQPPAAPTRRAPWAFAVVAAGVLLFGAGGVALVSGVGLGSATLSQGQVTPDVVSHPQRPSPPTPTSAPEVPDVAPPPSELVAAVAAPVPELAAGPVPRPPPDPVGAAPNIPAARPDPVERPAAAPPVEVAVVPSPEPAPDPLPTPAPAPAASVTPSPAPSGPPVVHRSQVTFKLSPRPVYPEGQRNVGEVTCLATVSIDARGLPQSVTVSRCPDAFAANTRSAVMKSRFDPPLVDGVASGVTTTLPIKFAER